MANVFVSYAHDDTTSVRPICQALEAAGHDVRIDESFMRAGDPITAKIRRNIRDASFVLVFISPAAVKSKWVCQEILESLAEELKHKKARLIPCMIQKCVPPAALARFERLNRLYLDLSRDRGKAIEALLERTAEAPRSVFENEDYLVLDISEPGLNIYLTGDFVHWERNEYLKYDEMLESYLLFGFQRTSGDYFKHFVLCENRDAPRLREIVQCAGYEVTGTGSKDAEPGKRRVWFCLPDYPIVGDVRNNMWP